MPIRTEENISIEELDLGLVSNENLGHGHSDVEDGADSHHGPNVSIGDTIEELGLGLINNDDQNDVE